MAARVNDHDVALAVDGDAPRQAELALTGAPADSCDLRPGLIKDEQSPVVAVGQVQVAVRVEGDAVGEAQRRRTAV